MGHVKCIPVTKASRVRQRVRELQSDRGATQDSTAAIACNQALNARAAQHLAFGRAGRFNRRDDGKWGAGVIAYAQIFCANVLALARTCLDGGPARRRLSRRHAAIATSLGALALSLAGCSAASDDPNLWYNKTVAENLSSRSQPLAAYSDSASSVPTGAAPSVPTGTVTS